MNDKTTPDYANLVNLLSVFSEAHGRLAELQSTLDEQTLGIVDVVREDYAALQGKIAEAESAIRHLVKMHPEWFADGKTIKTPYGTVASRQSKSLAVPSEEASIRLIKACGRETEFVRLQEGLDLESLEKLPDAELARFGIIRTVSDSLTVKPLKVDIGRAVRTEEPAGEPKAKAKAKAAK